MIEQRHRIWPLVAVMAVALGACGSSASDGAADTTTTSTTVDMTTTIETTAAPTTTDSGGSATPTTTGGSTDPDGDQSDNGQETDGVSPTDDAEGADHNVDLLERCSQGESLACYEVGTLGLDAPDGLMTGNAYTQAPDADVIEACNFQDVGEACYVAGSRGLELPEGP